MRRVLSLSALLVVSVWFGLGDAPQTRRLVRAVADRFDDRPVRRILFLGNSRTYYNRLPETVRDIADAAGAPERYEVVMRALPGASLETLWHDREARRLLAETRWDDVVIQAQSWGHLGEPERAGFFDYGERLIAEARGPGARTALVVNWTYAPGFLDGRVPEPVPDYDARIQADHRRLADRTGAALFNSGAAWRIVAAVEPALPLYTDGNHPTPAGSYISALTIAACLGGRGVFTGDHAPAKLDEGSTRRVRDALARGASTSDLCQGPISTVPKQAS